MSLHNRVVLITGASHGLGHAVARLFARQGSRLILTARGAPDLERAVAGLTPGSAVYALAGDVADGAHAERLVRQGEALLGPVDVLVNNASDLGATPLPALAGYPLDALERALRVNVVAPLHLVQLVLPGMLARSDGVIVNVTSDAAVEGYPGWGGYGASKAALEAISRVLAVETQGSAVRVYALDPGDMDTRMHRAADPDADPADLLRPDAVAPALLRLATDAGIPSGRYRAAELPAGAADGTRRAAVGVA